MTTNRLDDSSEDAMNEGRGEVAHNWAIDKARFAQ